MIRVLVPVFIILIIAAAVLIGIRMSRASDNRKKVLKSVRDQRDLAREQLSVAKKALTTEASVGSMNAQLALEDILKLQQSFDEQKELEIN